MIDAQPVENPQTVAPRTLRHWPRLVIVAIGSAVFWAGQYWYQYYIYLPGEFEFAWIRSHALTGATLIALALLWSAIFKWWPKTAKNWRWRRNLGVTGFVFIFLHVGGVLNLVLNYDLSVLFFTFNPFLNPILFGLPAYAVLIVMAITSSEWMVRRLKKWWKFIHRFIYLAEVGIIFHALLLGGPVLKTPPGYLLYAVGGVALVGQVYWWFRISRLRNFKNAGFLVGLGLIILALILWYWSVSFRT